VLTADQLFATLDPTTRRVELPSGRTVLATDTVGFIQRLPTQLVAAFRATLEEIQDADVLLHVVDVTHPDVVRQVETVERILEELGLGDAPMVVAANKVDLVDHHDAALVDAALAPLFDLYPDLVPISAARKQGIDRLLAAVDEELMRQLVEIHAEIPYQAGDVLHLVHSHGRVDSETYVETGTRIVAHVPAYLLGVLAPYVDAPAK
jgi:GTP-binding protein HflX